jgi:hypothetical protein
MKIARRFNAGQTKERSRVPEGRLNGRPMNTDRNLQVSGHLPSPMNGRAIPPQCLQHRPYTPVVPTLANDVNVDHLPECKDKGNACQTRIGVV